MVNPYLADRIERIERMWRRFMPAAARAEIEVADSSQPESQIMVMRNVLRQGRVRVPGFRPRNALEAADLVVDRPPSRSRPTGWKARPAARPVEALPGSEQKLAAMIERIASGEELFHDDDGWE